jgi:uncharacterized protein
MKIAVYGATGRVGSQVVAEALGRGHQVTALSRHAAATAGDATWQQGDAADAESVAQAAVAHDVVVAAHGPSREPGADHSPFLATIHTLADAAGDTRVVVVGGAGSLLAAPGVRLVDTPEFPDMFKAEALTHSDALEILRASRADLDWTYLSPAPVLGGGERTGNYHVGGDEPVGEHISVSDYAVALVDEIERPKHPRQRFTVAN